MKFGAKIFLTINVILSAIPMEIEENITVEKTHHLTELYEPFLKENQLNIVSRLLIHYICHEEDMLNIKNLLLLKIDGLLNSNELNMNEDYLVLKKMRIKIKEGVSLRKFTSKMFNFILIKYYNIPHCNLSTNDNEHISNCNRCKRFILNKSIFENILRKRKSINNLNISFPEVYKNDCINLIDALGNNLHSINITNANNLDLFKISEKCNESAQAIFEISLHNFNFELDNCDKASELLDRNISTLELFSCNLNSNVSVSFLKALVNSKNIVHFEDLIIHNTEIAEKDVDCIINILNINESALSWLELVNLKIKDELLIRLLNKLENDEKIDIFELSDHKITSTIANQISNILKNNTNIMVFTLMPIEISHNDVTCIADGLIVNKTLHEFKFCGDNISLSCFNYILEAILKNPLSKLKLVHFYIDRRLYFNEDEKDNKIKYLNLLEKVKKLGKRVITDLFVSNKKIIETRNINNKIKKIKKKYKRLNNAREMKKLKLKKVKY